MENKIFLGGTCAETTWRQRLIVNLHVPYFNPVVSDWTEDCQENERVEKVFKCNIHFYLISKDMIGVFSIAEVVDSVHQADKVTILHVLPDGFGKSQLKSLKAVVDLVNQRGGIAYVDDDLLRSARILNNSFV